MTHHPPDPTMPLALASGILALLPPEWLGTLAPVGAFMAGVAALASFGYGVYRDQRDRKERRRG